MASERRDPGWRDRAAGELLLRHFPSSGSIESVMVAGDPLPDVPEALASGGLKVTEWSRRALGGRAAAPWPPRERVDAVALRLPRSKGELAMSLAAVAGALDPGGALFLYGAKDEGIASSPSSMRDLFIGIETLGVGGRCRVLRGVRGSEPEGPTAGLEDWREIHLLQLFGAVREWVSYPGVFSHGRLDGGTALLLDVLPVLEAGARVLDYGCGSGILGAAILHGNPAAEVHLLDVDAVALEAARENVPRGKILLADGLPRGEAPAYDAIISNPPFHRGKGEDPGMITALIRKSPALLKEDGKLILVAQKRLPLEQELLRAFRGVERLVHGSGYQVWEGKGPRG